MGSEGVLKVFPVPIKSIVYPTFVSRASAAHAYGIRSYRVRSYQTNRGHRSLEVTGGVKVLAYRDATGELATWTAGTPPCDARSRSETPK